MGKTTPEERGEEGEREREKTEAKDHEEPVRSKETRRQQDENSKGRQGGRERESERKGNPRGRGKKGRLDPPPSFSVNWIGRRFSCVPIYEPSLTQAWSALCQGIQMNVPLF